ncbi:MAG TPA: DUF1425 domain-containing protein [Tepidisphaeraceae bacterium]|jgi:hypothetical protein
MKRSSGFIVTTAAMALAGFGCNNAVRDPIQPRQDIYHTGDPAQVFFDSFNLRNDTAADTATVVRDANGLLHVTVPIRSVIDKQLYVEYRVIFFDHDHREIDRSPWRDKTLPANIPESVSITATNPRAESFHVHFRYPTESEM